MVIKILGSGCAKCKKLEENVRKVVLEGKLNAEIIKVSDLKEIMSYGVMMTPALVVDEKVLSSGKLLSPAEIIKLIS